MPGPLNRRGILCLAAAAALPAGAAAQQRRTPAGGPARKPSAPPKSTPPKPPPQGVTAANLPALLRTAGYRPVAQGALQRVQVEEQAYGYFIDVTLSKTGDWLACMAHLAPVPDLTKVAAQPLMNLLSANDAMLGMYFSYDRVNARVMLNAAIPARGLNADALRSILESLKGAVRETQPLWDTAGW
jgi:hypothetical protein